MSEEVTFKLKPKNYILSIIVRAAILCVWEYMKEEHMKIGRKENRKFSVAVAEGAASHPEKCVWRQSQEPDYRCHTGI